MSKLDRWVDNKVAQNIFIWCFLFIILMTAIQTEDRVIASLFAVALLAPPVYINNLFILPHFQTSTVLFFILFIINILVFTGISVFLLQHLAGLGFEWKLYFNFMGIMILALVFASALKIARDSFSRRQQEKEAELKLLKAQLNPHFLFNTLNNLYGLSVVKSDKLPSLMLKMSDLLRYSLYDTKETMVPVEKEVTYIENYMALEKIRLEDTTDITLVKEGDLTGFQIAPMLLIVFVENAFKHLGTVDGQRSRVAVSLKKEVGSLVFNCSNTIDTLSKLEEDMEKGKSGIGLKNAKKRLALMYPDKHNLSIQKTNSSYYINLKLNL